MLQYVVLIEVYEENLTLYKGKRGKEGGYFNSLEIIFLSVQFSSVAQSCPTLCNPMNHSMPGLLVHHQLPEFTQTLVYQVDDAIQPSNPLTFPFPDPDPSQHQGLFHESTLRMRWPKYWSFSFSISPSNEHQD